MARVVWELGPTAEARGAELRVAEMLPKCYHPVWKLVKRRELKIEMYWKPLITTELLVAKNHIGQPDISSDILVQQLVGCILSILNSAKAAIDGWYRRQGGRLWFLP